MAAATAEKKEPVKATRANPAPKRFELPAEFPAAIHVTVNQHNHYEGLVATEDVPELIEAFSIPNAQPTTFPWQRLNQRRGEEWMFRIDPAAMYTVENKLQSLHRWSYIREVR